jgi:hypothetical protein
LKTYTCEAGIAGLVVATTLGEIAMSQFNDEEIIKDLIFRLFRAENHQTRPDATEILATDYLLITRWKGQVDTSRDDALEKIGAGSPLFVRYVE